MAPNKITKPEFSEILKRGRSVKSRFFLIRILKTNSSKLRFRVVVPIKMAKQAVRRNKIRRVVKGVITADKKLLGLGYDMIISVKDYPPLKSAKADLIELFKEL